MYVSGVIRLCIGCYPRDYREKKQRCPAKTFLDVVKQDVICLVILKLQQRLKHLENTFLVGQY